MTIDKLNLCLNQLEEAKSDEQVLIGLALLPKLLDPNDLEAMKLAFSSIPWKFIHRLLISPLEHDGLMQMIALQIWSGFAIPPFCNSKRIYRRIEPISSLLASTIDNDIKELVLKTFISLQAEEVFQKLCAPLVLDNIVKVRSSHPELLLQLMNIFIDHVNANSSTCMVNITNHFLETCIFLLQQDNITKFESLTTIIKIISMDHCDSSIVIKYSYNLKLACRELFHSKLSKKNSQSVLILCALMANLTENTFLHPQPDVDNLTTSFSTQSLEENKSKEKDTKSAVKKLSDIQFLVMITHLAGAEIRFILDSTKKDISENDNESLPLLYSLLEGVVQYLVVEDSVQLGEKVLESLKNALYETYLAVASFLSERWDVYQMAQDKGAIDNMTTLFTIGAYSRWIAEETSVTPEEMETLVPLIVWVLEQKSFDSLQTDPFNLIAELLAFITSETVTLDAFLKLEGLTFTVSHFKTAETDIQRLEIAAILLNIVVSSDVNTLERYGEVLRELFPILINLMTSDTLVVLTAHSVVLYLFLYRLSNKFQRYPLPLKAVMSFIGSKAHLEEVHELWYLSVSALIECPIEGVDFRLNNEAVNSLLVLKSNLIENEDLLIVTKLLEKLQRTIL